MAFREIHARLLFRTTDLTISRCRLDDRCLEELVFQKVYQKFSARLQRADELFSGLALSTRKLTVAVIFSISSHNHLPA